MLGPGRSAAACPMHCLARASVRAPVGVCGGAGGRARTRCALSRHCQTQHCSVRRTTVARCFGCGNACAHHSSDHIVLGCFQKCLSYRSHTIKQLGLPNPANTHAINMLCLQQLDLRTTVFNKNNEFVCQSKTMMFENERNPKSHDMKIYSLNMEKRMFSNMKAHASC